MPIFEALTQSLCTSDAAVSLMLKVLNDVVQLKFGKRISQSAVIHIVQTFNMLFKQKLETTLALDKSTRHSLASTLGLVYYFKHGYVM